MQAFEWERQVIVGIVQSAAGHILKEATVGWARINRSRGAARGSKGVLAGSVVAMAG